MADTSEPIEPMLLKMARRAPFSVWSKTTDGRWFVTDRESIGVFTCPDEVMAQVVADDMNLRAAAALMKEGT